MPATDKVLSTLTLQSIHELWSYLYKENTKSAYENKRVLVYFLHQSFHFNVFNNQTLAWGLWLQLSFTEKLPRHNQTEVPLRVSKVSFFMELSSVIYPLGQND